MLRILILLLALPLAAEETWSVSEVKAGMKGYGKSVFRGTEIERFNVEVIDVLKNFFPKQDIILIRCSAHPVIEQANIIAGMSGSPIYLFPLGAQEGEKLAGALAYGWGFTKEPIAGVTPIEYMIGEMERPIEKTGRLPFPADSPVQPCGLPLVLSGCTPRAIAALGKALDGTGLFPMEGGGGGATDGPEITIEPGCALGVSLMTGDFDATATGTVTWVEGDRVLAFGHPFFGGGETPMPVSSCVIHTVMPSLQRSFKMSSPVKKVGILVQDRANAIFARMGQETSMMPFEVLLSNAKTGRSQAYRGEVVRHPLLTGAMLNSAVQSALEVFEESLEENSVVAETRFEIEGRPPVVSRTTWANPVQVFTPVYLDKVVQVLGNRHEATALKSLTISLEVVHHPQRAEIESMRLVEDDLAPGQEAHLVVTLRPYRGERVTRDIVLRIPDDEPDGELLIQVASGTQVPPDLPPVDDLDGLLARIAAQHGATDLVAVMETTGLNLRWKGKVVRRLPNTLLAGWIPQIEGPAELSKETLRIVTPTEWVLSGTVAGKVLVNRRNK